LKAKSNSKANQNIAIEQKNVEYDGKKKDNENDEDDEDDDDDDDHMLHIERVVPYHDIQDESIENDQKNQSDDQK
jgi:hypothetical protein